MDKQDWEISNSLRSPQASSPHSLNKKRSMTAEPPVIKKNAAISPKHSPGQHGKMFSSTEKLSRLPEALKLEDTAPFVTRTPDEPSFSERRTQSNSALLDNIASLKISQKSTSAQIILPPRVKGSFKHLTLSIKPSRLDTKIISKMSPQKTSEFSPLSANTAQRAALFLDLCIRLEAKKLLPPWYSEWVSSKNIILIRAYSSHLFQILQDLEIARAVLPLYSIRQSHIGANKHRNRYADISPYDNWRVILNSKKSDYINASHISSFGGFTNYIASQGPLPNTFGDFWHMVWDQNSVVIVMLTREEESGRLKCHRYWPEKPNTSKRYFKAENNNAICYKIWYSEEISLFEGAIIIRELIVQQERVLETRDEQYTKSEPRMVRIINFIGWSDHDSCDPRALCSLIDLANEANSPGMNILPDEKPGPMIVHCSAGVGRTGTFCCADTIFHLLSSFNTNLSDFFTDSPELPENDLISHIVNAFRKQRPGIVQTSAQFHLLYEVVLLRIEALHQDGKRRAAG